MCDRYGIFLRWGLGFGGGCRGRGVTNLEGLKLKSAILNINCDGIWCYKRVLRDFWESERKVEILVLIGDCEGI